jgi:hypothetical protein
MPRIKKAIPELKVVFDTNVLFTQAASDLLRVEVQNIIQANSQHVDLKIQWLLPTIVIDERRYQMRHRAFALLPSIKKLEKLLGHNLNITEEIVSLRVDDAIEKQLSVLGVSILDFDANSVDWNGIINRSVYRYPPFEPGDKEKGFRDSLIAESFLQLLKDSPSTPSICRLALVTGDELLTDYIRSCTKESKNVRVLSSISELESLINTLVSQVTEEFVADISVKINKYFFEKENDTSLFYKENIRERIVESYGEELNSVPKKGLSRENGTWRIGLPVFIKKERQRLSWITSINIDAKLFKFEFPEPSSLASFELRPPSTNVEEKNTLRDLRLLSTTLKKVEVNSGKTTFEVLWSVNITQTKKLTSPQIDKIEFISTKWGEE